MGLSEYLAGDLALLDDPDLVEDDADLVRDLEHFRRQQQAERAARRAARQAGEASRFPPRRQELAGGSSTSSQPAPADVDPGHRPRQEASFVDETRYVESPDRQSSTVRGSFMRPSAPADRSSPDGFQSGARLLLIPLSLLRPAATPLTRHPITRPSTNAASPQRALEGNRALPLSQLSPMQESFHCRPHLFVGRRTLWRLAQLHPYQVRQPLLSPSHVGRTFHSSG